MKTAQAKVMLPAVGLAVMMHLLLFTTMKPKGSIRLSGIPVAPETSYLVRSLSGLDMSGQQVRTIRSPVVFSLPSGVGFSRELNKNDVRTRLTFSQDVETEQFLAVEDSVLHPDRILDTKKLLLTESGSSAPGLPVELYETVEKRASARRVNLTPALKERLDGGVVLPAELNQETDVPWEIHASVSISDSGMVKHVLLDQPLESSALNQKVLQLLYGLRFKPGNNLEGSVEIYSPEKLPAEAVQ